MISDDWVMNLRTVTVNRVRYAIENSVGLTHLDPGSFMVNVVVDEAARKLVIKLEAHLASGIPDVRTETVTVSYPAGPWAAFKVKYFPRWYLSRYPAKMTTEVFEKRITTTRVCPHLPIGDPQSARTHLQFLTLEPPR